MKLTLLSYNEITQVIAMHKLYHDQPPETIQLRIAQIWAKSRYAWSFWCQVLKGSVCSIWGMPT